MMKCKVEQCEEEMIAKQYCNRHYAQFRRNGKITYIEKRKPKYKTQKCKVGGCENLFFCKDYCQRHFNQIRFHGKITHVDNFRHRNKGKKCSVNGCNDKIRVKNLCNKHYSQRVYQVSLYNITWKDKEEIFAKQEGKCCICLKEILIEDCVIDHCHNTGNVRGLLCLLCNFGLGSFQENKEFLLRAYEYLNKFIPLSSNSRAPASRAGYEGENPSGGASEIESKVVVDCMPELNSGGFGETPLPCAMRPKLDTERSPLKGEVQGKCLVDAPWGGSSEKEQQG